MARCDNCVRYDASMARQVTPPPEPVTSDVTSQRRPTCPPEDASILCRTKKPPRRMPPEEKPRHVSFAMPASGQSQYSSVSRVPKELLEDPEHWCMCCKRESNIAEPCGENVTQSIKLVYEMPRPTFRDVSVTQHDFHKHPIPKRTIPPWHPCKTEFWSRPDVPSVSETTYQRDYLPPPFVRDDQKSVLLMPKDKPYREPCVAVPCYRNICDEEPLVWDVYRKTDDTTKQEQSDNHHELQDQNECGTQRPTAYLVQPQERPRHDLTLCGNTSANKNWWNMTCCEPKEHPVVESEQPCPKRVFRPETTYEHDFMELPPDQRDSSEFYPRTRAVKIDPADINGANTTHKAHYKPPNIQEYLPKQPLQPNPPNIIRCQEDYHPPSYPTDYDGGRNPCYWAKHDPNAASCWNSKKTYDNVVDSGQYNRDLSARNYETNIQEVRNDDKCMFESSHLLSKTSEGHRPWVNRSVYA